jgi:hypothetical protein
MANFAFVQGTGTTVVASSSFGTITMQSSSTAGDIFIVAIQQNSNNIVGVSDNLSNTYVPIISTASNPALFLAANIAAGSATMTVTCVTSSSESTYFAAEYKVPQYTMVYSDWNGIQTTRTTWPAPLFASAGMGGTATEGLIILAFSNGVTAPVYTLSSGTMRGTQTAGALTLALGDCDVAGTGGIVDGTTTASNTATFGKNQAQVNFVAYTGFAGGVRESDWSGGMRG